MSFDQRRVVTRLGGQGAVRSRGNGSGVRWDDPVAKNSGSMSLNLISEQDARCEGENHCLEVCGMFKVGFLTLSRRRSGPAAEDPFVIKYIN